MMAPREEGQHSEKTDGASSDSQSPVVGDDSSRAPDPPSRGTSTSSTPTNNIANAQSTSMAANSETPTSVSVDKLPPNLPPRGKSSNMYTTPAPKQRENSFIVNHSDSDSLVHLLPSDLLVDSPVMSTASSLDGSHRRVATLDSIDTPKEQSENLAGENIIEGIENAMTPPPVDDDDDVETTLSISPEQEQQRMPSIASVDILQQNGSHPLHQRQPTGTHIAEKESTKTPPQTDSENGDNNNNDNLMTEMVKALQEQQQQLSSPTPRNNGTQRQPKMSSPTTYLPIPATPNPTPVQPKPTQQIPGRRSIKLHLIEEIPARSVTGVTSPSLRGFDTPFKSLRRFRSLSLTNFSGSSSSDDNNNIPKLLDEKGAASHTVDRGAIIVSWYEGTTSNEMTDHVYNCVLRKLNSEKKVGIAGKIKLEDVRLLDENDTSQGEVVICPFLPDGSAFMFKFKTSIERPVTPPKVKPTPSNYVSSAPESPSAEPSPYPSSVDLPSLSLGGKSAIIHQNQKRLEQQNAQQTQLLKAVAALLQQQQHAGLRPAPLSVSELLIPPLPVLPANQPPVSPTKQDEKKEDGDSTAVSSTPIIKATIPPPMESISENPTTDDLIEKQLRQLNQLFIERRSSSVVDGEPSTSKAADTSNTHHTAQYRREEKKQVIFVISNYLVLFMSLIALSAEIQSRLPKWMDWVLQNYDSVQNCATDKESLIECLSNGDFSGLVASFLLWATQSASAKRIFLFGFDTPKKLWTVVYEALVTAVCWGISYLFIRRGLNPNTRHHFLAKYWKDAVYGSLAGFNAAFMKAVLKNLVSQDAALEALEGRQLRIFSWLGSLMESGVE